MILGIAFHESSFPGAGKADLMHIPGFRRFGLLVSGFALCLTLQSTPGLSAVPAEAKKAERLIGAAIARTKAAVTYDPAYIRIPYPAGDVADDRGVCTDVIIRSYRAGLGVDLQKRVHEDMRRAFRVYPKNWGLRRPDPNIDHRRVHNLRRYFERHGSALPVTKMVVDYKPGDLVTWRLPGNLPHIGIVTDRPAPSGARLIVHNIGQGTRLEDMLFSYPITGHYRYLP